MRLVLDTNVAASGLLWSTGPPGRLIDAGRGRMVDLFTSTALLAELGRILSRKKFARYLEASTLSVDDFVLSYAALATVIVPASIPPKITQDPDDDQVLACALAAQAELIVSGDHTLLNLKTYHGIDIVTASEALRRMAVA